MFRRIVLIVLDSVGVGDAPDAARFGDEGADTLGHILEAVGLTLPQMAALGLGATSPRLASLGPHTAGAAGTMAERSDGKDTMTGHFELAGVITPRAYPTYTTSGFPAEIIDAFCAATGVDGVLGNAAASGTAVIDDLGAEHVRTGRPIVYTSADSVFQIAAHEDVIPVERLYEMCRITREQILPDIARVIARPFVGTEGAFARTKRRKDFAVEPPEPTVLDRLTEAGRDVVAVGKIGDIFSMRGIARRTEGKGNPACIDDTLRVMRDDDAASLIFVNLVDFDTLYGHRNDPAGYRDCLQDFDRALADIRAALADDELLLITADHGNDPCFPGTDHTRERVPLLAYRHGLAPTALGQRACFADVAATIADNFGVPSPVGESFLAAVRPD